MYNLNIKTKNRPSKNQLRLIALITKIKNTLSPIVIKYVGVIILCFIILHWMLEKVNGSDSELLKWDDPKNFYLNVSIYYKYMSMRPFIKKIEDYKDTRSRKTDIEPIPAIKKWPLKNNITANNPETNFNIGLPACSVDKKTLGPVKIFKKPLTVKWVMNRYGYVQFGGVHSPPHCRAKFKVAIIVPYRRREENLTKFLYHLHPFLKKQLIEYRIIVVEQTGQRLFNKGVLMNVGFLKSQDFGNFDCYIFHDVDLLPLDSRNLYSCREHPTLLATIIETGSRIKLNLYGGVTMFTKDRFKIINGYSNCYWGGGVEDDLFIRLRSRNHKFQRADETTGRYAALPHKRDVKQKGRFKLLATARKRYKIDGLKSLNYTLISVGNKRLFTHIMVDISGLENTMMRNKCYGQGDIN